MKKKSYEISFLKKISYSLIVFVFFIFITEILTRTAISLVTKNQKTFQYGFNKNIKIHINHLIKLKINLIDLPNKRNTHKGEVPLVGGICIYILMLLAIYLFDIGDQLKSIVYIGSILIIIGIKMQFNYAV